MQRLAPLAESLSSRALVLALAATLALAGCGKVPGGVKADTAGITTQLVDGHKLVKLGFGQEGGEQPALAHTADGWVAVYAGTRSGDRRLYSTTSADGEHWSARQPLGTSDFSDQAPAFVTDAVGQLNLYFTSNRAGDDYQVYHSRYTQGNFTAASAVTGTQGVSDLAVGYAGGKYVLAAETLGTGLIEFTGTDGEHFTVGKPIADAGFEPAITALPNGKWLVVYTHDGGLYARVGQPGAWQSETTAASGSEKLHEPALVWLNDHGLLAYAEHTPDGYKLRARSFDAQAQFGSVLMLPDAGGDERAPAVWADGQGGVGLFWGMKYSNGQQGVIFSPKVP